MLALAVSTVGGCRDDRVPAIVAERAVQHCEAAAVDTSPDHYHPTLSGASVRRLKDARYRVRATLNGHGTPKSFECRLDDANGEMEILGLTVIHH